MLIAHSCLNGKSNPNQPVAAHARVDRDSPRLPGDPTQARQTTTHDLTNLAKECYLAPMTRTFTIGEAKTHLSNLIALAEEGERVELRRGKEPVAQLVPLSKADAARRKPGALAGRIKIGEDFDSWPEDVAAALGVRD